MYRAGICAISVMLAGTLRAQQSDQETIRQLTQRLEQSEQRIHALEQRLGMASPAPTPSDAPAVAGIDSPTPSNSTTPQNPAASPAPPEDHMDAMMGHSMEIPGGGPELKIRG